MVYEAIVFRKTLNQSLQLERAVKHVAGEQLVAFSGDNLGTRVTLFNEKLVSKINEDRWNEVLSKCMPKGIDDIESGDEGGDRSILDHIGGDVFDFESPGKRN